MHVKIKKKKKKYTGYFIECDFSQNTFFSDFLIMHSIMYSSSRIFRHIMLQLWQFEFDPIVVQEECAPRHTHTYDVLESSEMDDFEILNG